MKLNYFNRNMLPPIFIFGAIGAILMLGFIIFSPKLNIKAPWSTLIYPLIIFSTILYYKIIQKNDVNYWKAVIITFLVCCVITLPPFFFLIIQRINELKETLPDASLLEQLTPFIFMLLTGVTISLVIGLFFLKFKRKKVL